MKITDLYSDILIENTKYEFKAQLNQDNPVKWAKSIVGYANGEGGYLFVGVANDGEAFGLTLDEVDKTKNLVALVNDRHIFPHAKLSFLMRSVDDNAEHFVLGIKVVPADSVVRFRDRDFNETVFVRGDGNTAPSIRRNTIIAACLDVANLMERGGTGFQTMIDSYKDSPSEKQPCVMIYPGFLDLRLYDKLFNNSVIDLELSDSEKVIELLKNGQKGIKELQEATKYGSRSHFLEEVINPLIEAKKIVRIGSERSRTSTFKLL